MAEDYELLDFIDDNEFITSMSNSLLKSIRENHTNSQYHAELLNKIIGITRIVQECKIKIDSSKIEDCKISNLKKLFNSKMKERYNLTVDLINSLNNSIDNKKSIPSSSGAF